MSTKMAPLTPEQQDECYLDKVPVIDELWRAGYDDEVLEYHVWSHGVGTYEVLADIRAELRANGAANVPGEFVTHLDGKGHDYFYRKYFTLKSRGDTTYDSAEHLTIAEGGDMLRTVGIDESTIREWAQHVAGTQLGKLCTSIGAYTLCAADMANTGRDYATLMRPDTEKLRVEKSRLEQATIDPLKFDIGSIAVISRYHFVNLGLLHSLARSPIMRELHANRSVNLGKLVLETSASAGIAGEEAVKNFLSSIGGYATRLWPFCQRGSAEPTESASLSDLEQDLG